MENNDTGWKVEDMMFKMNGLLWGFFGENFWNFWFFEFLFVWEIIWIAIV